jgi:hypothetical protein
MRPYSRAVFIVVTLLALIHLAAPPPAPAAIEQAHIADLEDFMPGEPIQVGSPIGRSYRARVALDRGID